MMTRLMSLDPAVHQEAFQSHEARSKIY